ncbi:MAG TPA: hypothetical protein VFW94_23725 [Candidatus Acidoferrales bacterium]|nr:hypothetical protein [Candidatus Acidoferrales bacterium]
MSIKITRAALDEQEHEIVLRGVIEPESLSLLKVADYQREELPQSKIGPLMVALQAGGVPDLQLGCRGGDFREREGAYYIADDVYIIDGLQRRTAALKLMEKGLRPHVGATICFNTTEELERKRFRALNISSVKLSPNVLLRNLRYESPCLQALYQLCLSSQFVFSRKISWSQRMRRGEILTATTLTKVTGYLHRRMGSALAERSHGKLVPALDRVMNKIGRAIMMANVREYFDVVNYCFRTGEVVYTDAAPSLRATFLYTLADVLGSFEDFWKDYELSVPAELRKKIARFPINDPHVVALCASGGSSMKILYNLIVDHINSGKRTKRLRPFRAPVNGSYSEEQEQEEERPIQEAPSV